MSKIFYCPRCGNAKIKDFDIINGDDKPTKDTLDCVYCSECLYIEILTPSKFAVDYYYNKSLEQYGDKEHWYEFLLPEIKENPIFDIELYEKRISKKEDNSSNHTSKITRNINLPKCPTCGSTNIRKISDAKKALHAIAFGIFSKTAYSQFECQNCHYKW